MLIGFQNPFLVLYLDKIDLFMGRISNEEMVLIRIVVVIVLLIVSYKWGYRNGKIEGERDALKEKK
jgi:hypothetical protein